MKRQTTNVICYRANDKQRKELNAAMRYLKFETRADTIRHILNEYFKRENLQISKGKNA